MSSYPTATTRECSLNFVSNKKTVMPKVVTNLKSNLNMKGKSILFQILMTMVIVLGSAGSLLGSTAMAWAGMIGAALTLIIKTFFPSGTLVVGWDVMLWATNIGAVVLQIMNLMSAVTFIDPALINAMMVIINTVILVIGNSMGFLGKK